MELTRQSLRQAKQRLQKGRFPFPEFARFIRNHLSLHPEVFMQSQPDGTYRTNLSGETQTLDLSGFYTLLTGMANKGA